MDQSEPIHPPGAGGEDAGRAAPAYDIVLRDGVVIDGTGRPGFVADVAVRGDRIVEIARRLAGRGAREIDATGLVVAPGFIDVHTHDDRAVIAAPECAPKITQGVTTVVTGNCGISLAPVLGSGAVPAPLTLIGRQAEEFFETFPAYLDALAEAAPSVNVVPMVGHMSLRLSAGVPAERAASAAEAARMAELLAAALREGACGFSTGLAYPFSNKAPAAEVVALVKVAAEHGAIYTTHMRDEGEGVFNSLSESFDAARQAGARLVISHHKCLGVSMWGRSVETLAAIDAAAATVDVAMDAYPYTASSTVLLAAKLKNSLETVITWSAPHPEAGGRRVDEIAAEWGCTPEEAAERLSPAGAIYVNMDEADVRRILKHPLCMIGSDGLPHDTHPHPRLWGTFPRVLGHYARDVGLFGLAEAVHRMTGLPARRFRIPGRGVVEAGAFADLCVFDPATVRDRADFSAATEPAAGIIHVLVNGRPALSEGSLAEGRSGRAIRNPRMAAQ